MTSTFLNGAVMTGAVSTGYFPLCPDHVLNSLCIAPLINNHMLTGHIVIHSSLCNKVFCYVTNCRFCSLTKYIKRAGKMATNNFPEF